MRSFCVCPHVQTKNHTINPIYELWTYLTWFSMSDLQGHLTGYIWLCYFRHPNAITPSFQKIIPKRRFVFRNMCPANCFGPSPQKKIHQISMDFFLPNQMIFWGLRYPFTNDIDGSSRSHSTVPTVLVIDSLMAKKISKASLIPQGKRVKHWDRKESHTLPEANIAPEKMVVGRLYFPIGKVIFQGLC